MTGPRAAALLLGAAELVLGVAMASSPALVLGRVGAERDAATLVGTRVLGARLVGQGTLVATVGRAWVHELSAGVDAVHAASMAAIAVASRGRRRAALTSGALALIAAAASGLIAGRIEEPT